MNNTPCDHIFVEAHGSRMLQCQKCGEVEVAGKVVEASVKDQRRMIKDNKTPNFVDIDKTDINQPWYITEFDNLLQTKQVAIPGEINHKGAQQLRIDLSMDDFKALLSKVAETTRQELIDGIRHGYSGEWNVEDLANDLEEK